MAGGSARSEGRAASPATHGPEAPDDRTAQPPGGPQNRPAAGGRAQPQGLVRRQRTWWILVHQTAVWWVPWGPGAYDRRGLLAHVWRSWRLALRFSRDARDIYSLAQRVYCIPR